MSKFIEETGVAWERAENVIWLFRTRRTDQTSCTRKEIQFHINRNYTNLKNKYAIVDFEGRDYNFAAMVG